MTRVAIDTGGTFTDVLLAVDGRLVAYKLPSTPQDPARAVLEGLAGVMARAGLAADAPVELALHGTTVGTNALLERQGARVLLVTTAGFEDLLTLARQDRDALYALEVAPRRPLVASADTIGVRERLGPDGAPLIALEASAIAATLEAVCARLAGPAPPEAVAICLLHAYASDAHERRLAAALRERLGEGTRVCVSSEVLPELREYERASTTVVDAYLAPRLERYLARLERELAVARLRVMQSSGGVASAAEARAAPVHLALSGPAGGVVGALTCARRAGLRQIVSFDMGGTSTDVAFCDGALALTSRGALGGLPVHVPMVDVHTVGAGGGSIAHLDAGGALKVGPRSAGADPGPACYGRGALPTVTDANLVLGRLAPDAFLGGHMRLDPERAGAALDRHLVAGSGLSREAVAAGVLEVVAAAMARAVKVISLERGHDPRDAALVAFGGAGAMHACDLADQLGMDQVLVPRDPGLLSALGMLHADVTRHASRALLRPAGEAHAALGEGLAALRGELDAFLEREAVEGAARRHEAALDLRYRGQSFELRLPLALDAPLDAALADACARFEQAHERRYGYRIEGGVIEVVTARMRGVGLTRALPPPAPPRGDADPRVGQGRAYFGGRWHDTPHLARARLGVGLILRGPAIVLEYSTTTVLPPGWGARVLAHGDLLIERDGG